jgi:hypothetical protein
VFIAMNLKAHIKICGLLLQGSVADSPKISLDNLNLDAHDIEADYTAFAESSSFGRNGESDFV